MKKASFFRLLFALLPLVLVLSLSACDGGESPRDGSNDQPSDVICNGHTYGVWITDSEATCVAEGARHRICAICTKNEAETIPTDEAAHVFSTECTADFTCIYTACTVKGCTATQKFDLARRVKERNL